MSVTTRVMLCVCLSWLPSAAFAQNGLDPSGHWSGSIDLPAGSLDLEFELAKSSAGEFFGTVTIPDQGVKAVPLTHIVVTDRSIGFQIIQSAQGDNLFDATLASVGHEMSGTFTHKPYAMNFHVSRTGDARLTPPGASTPIEKALEGEWAGALDVEGQTLHVALTLSTLADGTAAATLVSVDQGNLKIPVNSVVQHGVDVALDVRMVGGTFAGVHNAGTHELKGTWTQGPLTVPLTLTRVGDGK